MSGTAVVDNAPVHDAPRAHLPPVDPSVVIPEAVRRAAEIAENYYKKPDAPVAPVAGAPAEPTPPPVGDPPAPPTPPLQVTAPVTPPEPAPLAPLAPAGEDGDWEHKFKSQQGRIGSQAKTIQQLQDQLADMGNELSRATQFIEQVQAQQNAPAPERLITDEDETTFGSDFINVARKAAKETMSPEVEGLKHQVASLEQSLQETAKRNFYVALDRDVPNWRIVNRDANFSRWLGLRDPMSGAIRKVLLDGAFRAADAARVAAIFKGFVAVDAASRPADPASLTPPAPEPPAPARQAVVALETLAAPGRARSVPATSATTEKSTYTTRDISKFYDDVRKGLYAGRDADKMARENDIFAAQREGRVIG